MTIYQARCSAIFGTSSVKNPRSATKSTSKRSFRWGIAHPEILTPDERALLDRIRQDEPDKFRELQMIAEFSPESFETRPHCSRFIPFAHALSGFLIAGILLWWLGVDRRWVCYLAALPTLYGLWSLKSALFDAQATLDRNLYDDR
jgi:hypothetical protein